MFHLFELIMTGILGYMAFTLVEGAASPVVLALLTLIQLMFWTLDIVFIRSGAGRAGALELDARNLSGSYSRG